MKGSLSVSRVAFSLLPFHCLTFSEAIQTEDGGEIRQKAPPAGEHSPVSSLILCHLIVLQNALISEYSATGLPTGRTSNAITPYIGERAFLLQPYART
ncbi:hypothetical protein EI94DRAFT_1017607 [Lactarius quietus]|nr:hypothetical protein EI94DRAFT_1017607 [Lactarius quietus]